MTQLNKTQPDKINVIVGMSGGVDSSVAARLLSEQGYNVSGIFMRNWEEDDNSQHCTAAEDANDAMNVCDVLDISLDAVNFSQQYWERVFDYFLQEYRCGRTPNPDILCNKEIKFKAFLDHARQQGADFIATGHYARSVERDGQYHLLKALDDNKDQTYFLYTLNQYQLAHSLFPLGEIEKPEVRRLAQESGFANHAKKDSTGICFIGERNFKKFLNQYIPAQPGKMETPEGEVVGEHSGLMFYTLGQRQGLGIGGTKGADSAPWYVLEKELQRNVLVVGQSHDHPLLYKNRLNASQLHWVSGAPPQTPYRCHAKTRYRQPDQPCTIESIDNDCAIVRFTTAQRALTPGQSVVFYYGDECLGGGTIDHADNTT
ncbi:MAG: tRNA 2-thiouridine(34) synthase MnmA [Gammaproteobacteria bacterium]|nr:tRNA 2-thiouridine(34) synthase MnmA [Gammaproteobacteria bacterium]